MSYTKTNWSNNVAPAISATNLNKIEQGIYDAHDKLDGITDTVTDVVFDHDALGRSVLKKTIKNNDTGESTVTKMVVPGDGDTTYTFDTQNSSRGEFRVSSSDGEDEPYQVMIKDGDKLADKDVVAELGAHNFIKLNFTTEEFGGVTFTNNGNGTITVNGENTSGGHIMYPIGDFVTFKPGRYFLSGCPSDGGALTYNLRLHPDRSSMIMSVIDVGDGFDFTTDNDWTTKAYIFIGQGETVSNKLFKPMVSYFYASRDFHPYAMTNRDITDALSYSTAERVVGYWLDGKPIYQKTFSLSSLNCVANNWTQTSIPRGSMEMIIDISVLIESSTPSVHKGLSGGFINDYVAINSFRTFGTDTGDVAYVTIQYTKTTD